MKRFLDDALVNETSLVVKCHLYKNRDGEYNTFANRSRHGFVFFLSGKIKFIYDNEEETFEATENSFVYLPKGRPYQTYPTEPGDFILINFDTYMPVDQPAFGGVLANNLQIQGCFVSALKQYKQKKVGSNAELLSIIYKIIALVQSSSCHGYLPYEHFRKLEPAINYINENFLKSDIKITELADLCGISRKYFTTLFTTYYETTPKQYLLNCQIDYARKLLITEGKGVSVTQIAEKSGFTNIYYFSKLFKARVGVTPTEYKKQNG